MSGVLLCLAHHWGPVRVKTKGLQRSYCTSLSLVTQLKVCIVTSVKFARLVLGVVLELLTAERYLGT